MLPIRRSVQRAASQLNLSVTRAMSAEPVYEQTMPGKVNGVHVPDPRASLMDSFSPRDNSTDVSAVSKKHWDEAWSTDDIRGAVADHAMTTWTPSNALKGVPVFVRGEGVYLYDSEGKEYIDLTSQAICANFGHTTPEPIKAAIAAQLNSLPFLYGGLGVAECRARLSALLNEVTPPSITGFMFPSGGGEANEAAIRMARRYTGRHKVLSHYRSYHGGTTSSLAATGDFRRWHGESGAHGHLKAFGPSPWHFGMGSTEAEEADRALVMLEEQVLLEGPHTVACILLESIVGAGGAFKYPAHYMQGVRSLCDQHGILLICDEVMVGFGRSGPMWGFQHYDGVVPDMMTSAKGLSASFMPLALVGVSEPIKRHFDAVAPGWGSTYQAHPVPLACAYAAIKHSLDIDLLGHVKALTPVFEAEVARLVEEHPSVARGRAHGLFGCLDLVGPDGKSPQRLEGPPAASLPGLKAALAKHGVVGLLRFPLMHLAPPLTITEPELKDAMRRVSAALADSVDREFAA